MALPEYDHDSLLTALATFGGYGLILVVMTLLLFGLPYLVVSSL
jgi:hypothetical protein